MTQPLTSFETAAIAANVADAKKGLDILMLDTAHISCLSDYFVLCSGESKAQIRTIAEEIERVLSRKGLQPIGRERDSSMKWCLLDYGDVVIHVLHKTEREYYQLEQFWSHANEVPQTEWLSPALYSQAS